MFKFNILKIFNIEFQYLKNQFFLYISFVHFFYYQKSNAN